jgi:hypothetical protein
VGAVTEAQVANGRHFRGDDWYGDDLGAARFVECTFTDVDLSEATIKGYVSRVLDKLGCVNRTQAGLIAHDAGMVKS